jgi:hypothetical protein
MDKQITEYVLKLSGKASLLEPIDLSHNYKVQVDGSVVEVADADNQDGTYTRYYKYKPARVSVINEAGEMIKAKDVRRRSEQLRAAIWKEWQLLNEPVDFDTYYDSEMLKVIQDRKIF